MLGGPSLLVRVIVHVLLYVLALSMLLPFLWMVSTSLKTRGEAIATDHLSLLPAGWPWEWQWGNYLAAWEKANLGDFYWNSTLVAVVVTLLSVMHNALAGFAFAKLRFRGRRALFFTLLATMMLPFAVLLIPIYVAYNEIGLVNTFWPLILPHYFGNAFFIFLCRQFFLGIPQDLIDSARIDGAGELMIFLRIMVPLAKPAIIVVAILSFQNSWNEFLGPLIYLKDQNLHTLALGLYYFQGLPGQGNIANQQMAATVMMVLPVLIVFFIFQKQFIQGANLSGIKG